MAYAEELTTLPRIRDANNNRLVTKYAIHLYVDTGGVRPFDRFLVSDNLSVPCILGIEVIEQNIEGILPRLRKIVWQEHVRWKEELPRPTPILACLNDSAWDRHWQDRPARVRACKQVRVNGHKKEWIMATCDIPGMVTITPSIRLCRHKSMALARGIAIIKPDEPYLVKLCNFGKDQVIVRKNSMLDFKFELLRTIYTGIVAVAERYSFRNPTGYGPRKSQLKLVDSAGGRRFKSHLRAT